ncbi:MAG TPA: SDR family NAD(P)-dependent oxidoreductase [Acidimicrobiales bacterium]|jgi:NAD(P)-dependent dehydrogenase (short-subunit alcohol dehydrogenase family)
MQNPFDFTGKVVLVTGVARPGQIGHGVAKAFGEAGAKLVLADVNAVAVAERAREFTALQFTAEPAAGDLTDPDVADHAIEVAMKKFGRLDALVNVAGGLTTYGPAEKLDLKGFDREININLKTAFLMSRAAAGALERSKGAIVNFSSLALLRPMAPMAVYAAAKAGVGALTWSLAKEWLGKVRVNAVAPTTVRTPENMASITDPNAKYLELEQLIAAVMFLASPASSAITGHILPLVGPDL